LANTAQANKRARQAVKRNELNASQRSAMRTSLKGTVKAIVEGNRELASDKYKVAISMVDKMASKGLIHKNKAARHKSRLNARIKKLATA
jgi:small subunit ribosomal protein S20